MARPTSQQVAKREQRQARLIHRDQQRKQAAVGGGKKAKKKQAPVSFTAPITKPKQIRKEVGAATRLKYGPSERDLTQGFKANTAQQRHTQDWYDQYLGVVGQARQSQAAANAQAQSYLASQGNALAGLDAKQGQTQLSQMQADAAKRGATVNPQMAQTIQQASGARQAGLGNYQGLQGTLGANQGNYLTNVGVAGSAQQLRSHLDLLNARKDLYTKRGQLKSDEGDFATTYRTQLRESERNWRDKNRSYRLEKSAFGLNERQQTDKERHERAGEATARQNAKTSARSAATSALSGKTSRATFYATYGHSPEWVINHPQQAAKIFLHNKQTGVKGKGSSSGSGGDKYPHLATDAQETKIVSKIRNVAAGIRAATAKPGFNSTEYRQYLEQVKNVDHDIVNAAFDVAYLHGLSPANIRALHQTYHVQLGPHFTLLSGKQAKRRRQSGGAQGAAPAAPGAPGTGSRPT